MTKTSTAFVSALGSIAITTFCHAQPPGITPEMIATALPVEGAPLAEVGPYEVASGPAFGAPGLLVWHPKSLDAFPKRDTLPVVVWGNGGCSLNTLRYSGFLSTIASYGFVALGTAAPEGAQRQEGAPRRQATADDLRSAVDWAEKENARAGSPLNGKIATDKIAVMGQSCGGFLSITLGADPRVDTIGVFNSGAQPRRDPNAPATPFVIPDFDALEKLHGPVLLINGHERDFMMAQSKATYDAIKSLPAFYGARHGAGHTATVDHPGGGEFANVASSWVRWQLKGDKKAGAMFRGTKCGLCTNPNWDVESKGLEK
jgi:dienelactone hydrolase